MDGEADCTAEDPAGGDNMYFLDMTGYFLELQSVSEEAARLSIKVEYIGTTMGLLSFLYFSCLYSTHLGDWRCQADQAVLCGESSVYPGGGVYDRLQYDLLQESGTRGTERVLSVVY